MTAIVAVSHSIKRGLVAPGVPPDKIAVIYDPSAVATAVLGLIQKPDTGRILARAGRARVVSAFPLEAKVVYTEAL